MTKKLQNKKGFTLTELIVVIVIIGILAAVLIPTLTGYIKKANLSAAEQEAHAYVTAYNSWQVEQNLEKFDGYDFVKYCEEELELTTGTVEEITTIGQEGFKYTTEDGKYEVVFTIADNKLVAEAK